jgi:predicted MFS family arabinose efflux permease
MTQLDGSPSMVAAVRTAMTLPVLCLAYPAGVMIDRVDRRRWLLFSQTALLLIAAIMATLDGASLMTPTALIVLTTCMGLAMTLNQPAWQAMTPELVPLEMIPSAVAVGSVSFNLARSLGPALAGWLVAHFGTWVTFLFNAFSFLGVIVILLAWRPPVISHRQTHESFAHELRYGLVWLAKSATLRSVLARLFLFAFSASCLFSLLSLVASKKLALGASGFGILLGAVGGGAVMGTAILPGLRHRLTSEATVCISALIYAAISLLMAAPISIAVGFGLLLIVGAAWMTTTTTLNATAQIYLPATLRARGLAACLMSFAGGQALGSPVWGYVAEAYGLNYALLASGLLLTATTLLSARWPLGTLQPH